MQFDFASLWTWHTLSVVLDVLITWYFISGFLSSFGAALPQWNMPTMSLIG